MLAPVITPVSTVPSVGELDPFRLLELFASLTLCPLQLSICWFRESVRFLTCCVLSRDKINKAASATGTNEYV
jgi:hypothetical protein